MQEQSEHKHTGFAELVASRKIYPILKSKNSLQPKINVGEEYKT